MRFQKVPFTRAETFGSDMKERAVQAWLQMEAWLL